MLLPIRTVACDQTEPGSEHYWIKADTGERWYWLLSPTTGDHLVVDHDTAREMVIRIGRRGNIETDNWTDLEPM